MTYTLYIRKEQWVDGEKKRGVWMVTVTDKPPALRRGNPDLAVEEVMRREGLRKPKRKQPVRYIK